MTSLTPHDEYGRPRMNAREREQFRRELIAAQEKHKAEVARKVREQRARRKARSNQSPANKARAEGRARAAVVSRVLDAGDKKVTAGYWKRQVC